MKVLFAVDGSAGSFDAVEQVAPLLAPGQDSAALYCSPPASRFAATTSAEVLAEARQGFVDAIFHQARTHVPPALQDSVHTIVGDKDARHGIVAAAEAWSADLIVLGARGLGTFERLLLGSVSRAVVHAAQVPVWVARAGQTPRTASGRNILVACEDAESGASAAEMLAAFSWPEGSTCRTLTVVPSMFAGQVPDWLQHQARSPDVDAMVQAWAREHDEELHSARTRMEEFTLKLPANCHRYEPIVAEGEPSSVILATIAKEKVDVVALAAHRKNWLTTTLLGSTSEAVLNHAACSVLIVPLLGKA